MAEYKPFTIDGAATERADSDAPSSTDTGDSGDGTEPFFLGGGTDGSDRGDSRDAGGNEFDPDIHVARDKFNNDGTYRRKRGRRKSNAGGGSNNRRAGNQAGVEALANMLGFVHLGIASALKTPEIKLEDDESKALAQATARVLEEFDWTPDPKVQAVVGLIMTAGSIYAPKVYFIRERKKAEKVEREQATRPYGH